MNFDTRPWNLVAGAAVAAAIGCGGADQTEATADASDSADTWDDYCDAPGTSGTTPRCSTDEYWDEGYYDEGYENECDPMLCEFGTDCDESAFECTPVPVIPTCEPGLSTTTIPIGNLPFGLLTTVEREEETEFVLVAQQSLWRIRDGEVEEQVRAIPAHYPTDAEAVDLDGDGTPELAVADQSGLVVVLPLGEGEEAILPFSTRSLAWGSLEQPDPHFVIAVGGYSLALDVNGDGYDPIAESGEDVMLDSIAGIGIVAGGPRVAALETFEDRYRLTHYARSGSWLQAQALEQGRAAARIATTHSPPAGGGMDTILATSDGSKTRLKSFPGDGVGPGLRGLVPSQYTAHPPVVVHGGQSAVLLLGTERSTLVLYDEDVGALCEHVLPAYRTAAAADVDHDGIDELYVQELDGTLARLVVD